MAAAPAAAQRYRGATPRRPHWPRRRCCIVVPLAVLLIAAAAAAAAPGDRPGVFLEGANVPRARALALDAALVKGWRVTAKGRAHVVFETLLEQPAAAGPPDALPPEQTTLRIRADFIATPAGVNTYLHAEEVWWPGSEREWVSDVTQRYRENLMNALASLQQQWDSFAAHATHGTARPAHAPAAAMPDGAAPRVRVEPTTGLSGPTEPAAVEPVPTPAAVEIEVGIWAYYAESTARERGCDLGELGAELISSDGGSELHRVHCADGSTRMLRCDRTGCSPAD